MENQNKKIFIIIGIILFLIVAFSLLVLGRSRRNLRRPWLLSRLTPTATPYPTFSPPPSPTPKPTVKPTSPPPAAPQPTTPLSPTPAGRTYQTSISESEFNSYLAQGVAQQPPRENPFTSATADLQNEVGILNMHFENGQDLTAEVFVTADGKNLSIRNVSVIGATGFESTFIQIASDLIEDGLSNFVSLIAASIRIEKLEIQTDALVISYQPI